MTRRQPPEASKPTCVTTPSAAAYSAVPHAFERSMPLCIRHTLKIGCSRRPKREPRRPTVGWANGPDPPGPTAGPAARAASRAAARSVTAAAAEAGSSR